MSKNLYWEPSKPPEPHYIPYAAKWLLVKAFGAYDGSIGEEFFLDDSHLQVLRVLQKVNEDPETWQTLGEVIEAVIMHGKIRLWVDE